MKNKSGARRVNITQPTSDVQSVSSSSRDASVQRGVRELADVRERTGLAQAVDHLLRRDSGQSGGVRDVGRREDVGETCGQERREIRRCADEVPLDDVLQRAPADEPAALPRLPLAEL